MTRLILIFETLPQVLAADKLLKQQYSVRPAPAPAKLAAGRCVMAIEILDCRDKVAALNDLAAASLSPQAVYKIDEFGACTICDTN